MLVLTRKVGERLLLPGINSSIKFMGYHGNGAAKLAIEAPESVIVLREELLTPQTEFGTLLKEKVVQIILLDISNKSLKASKILDEITRNPEFARAKIVVPRNESASLLEKLVKI